MTSRREWIPNTSWGSLANVAGGSTVDIAHWGEQELYFAYSADEATFLRMKGHIIVSGVASADTGPIGWRLRVGLETLDGAGLIRTAGGLQDAGVAEEHYIDERYWDFDGTAQPSSWSHPYYTTFDSGSKRKLATPQAIVLSFLNTTTDVISVRMYLRGLFLFA